ncbi:class I SAM-dependent methyltransferase [Trinickia diaoshuihuensis]|uniref:class I SAM-dependent methyltransferase n=1 Tax=Trinickia diaoshuihuensis TaxID=2292265 RepID=UPI0019679BB7|nr:class I SAM-dependent methyltransferase [Trinickia diaoshuihuensis]
MDLFSPAERYLQDFHARRPGATSAAFSALPATTKSRTYKSSYEVLAAVVRDLPLPSTVLDVGCGDGHLLGLLDKASNSSTLIGVDLSDGELNVARRTLPSHVLLLRERAQQMSLASESIDVVVSHMALMLMDDIESVLSEIHRVLVSGGKLAGIVGRTFLLGPLHPCAPQAKRCAHCGNL